jgi:hypothetical protein
MFDLGGEESGCSGSGLARFINNVQMQVLRFISIWSIASITPILAILTDTYTTRIKSQIYRNTCFYLIGAAVTIFYSAFLGSFLILVVDNTRIRPFDFLLSAQARLLFFVPLIYWLRGYFLLFVLVPCYLQNISTLIILPVLLSSFSNYDIKHIVVLCGLCQLVVGIRETSLIRGHLKQTEIIETYVEPNHQPIRPIYSIHPSELRILHSDYVSAYQQPEVNSFEEILTLTFPQQTTES